MRTAFIIIDATVARHTHWHTHTHTDVLGIDAVSFWINQKTLIVMSHPANAIAIAIDAQCQYRLENNWYLIYVCQMDENNVCARKFTFWIWYPLQERGYPTNCGHQLWPYMIRVYSIECHTSLSISLLVSRYRRKFGQFLAQTVSKEIKIIYKYVERASVKAQYTSIHKCKTNAQS